MILRKDQRNYNCYRRVQFAVLACFMKVAERYGILVNKDHLRALGAEVDQYIKTQYRALMRMVPAKIKRKYIEEQEEMSFTRPKFLLDVLFSKDGFNLKPVKFTKSTADLEDKSKRVPSVSVKDHLPFFFDTPGIPGEFCRALKEYVQASKMLTTYVGTEDQGNGFWQYIAPDGAIYPSYKLHLTVTGRTASENPNGQNFPKRGRFAKAYNKIFEARHGHKIISADLSQIELRIAAWMAMDKTMLEIYRNNGDIHTATAAVAAGVSDQAFAAMPFADRKKFRRDAKPINRPCTGLLFSDWPGDDRGGSISFRVLGRV